jgi:hypothetical protein
VCESVSRCAGACIAAYVVEDDQRTVDAANGVVPYPRLDGHHAGVEGSHAGGVDERFGERWVSLKSAGFASAKGGGLRDLGDEVEVGGKLVVLQLGRNVSAHCTHMTRLQPQGSRQPPVHISIQQGKWTSAEAPLVVCGTFTMVTVPCIHGGNSATGSLHSRHDRARHCYLWRMLAASAKQVVWTAVAQSSTLRSNDAQVSWETYSDFAMGQIEVELKNATARPTPSIVSSVSKGVTNWRV